MSTAFTNKAVETEALDALARLGGEAFRNEDVAYEGRKLIIPEGMTLQQARAFLKAKIEEDEEETRFQRVYKFRPWDGAVALVRALERAFGSVRHVATPGFFGPELPNMVDVATGPDSHVSVPWARIEVPLLEGLWLQPFQTESDVDGMVFGLVAEGPRKWRHHVEGIFNLVEDELAKTSIYRGKAFDGKSMPAFLDLSGIDPAKIVYAEETRVQLEASVFAPIRYPDALESFGVSGKRAVLLHGPYGTGKTSTAMLVAKEAVENGWTFLYAVPGRDDLHEVMRTAKLYQPSVVFFEDLDTIADPEDGRESITTLLDLFDGFTSKGTRILAILTTNHPERIHKGMVRPGRLDAMIELGAPDAAGIRALVENAIPAELLASINWPAVAESMDGYLPAFVAEASGRAIRYAVVRKGGEGTPSISTGDLVNAAEGLRPQWRLMQDAPETGPADHVGTAIARSVTDEVAEMMEARYGFASVN